ncbi:MAG TPA: efflux RND transporter periplasmic adaptor subunit, partial [Candidatus Binatia bacterium]|nr:efflux RND transporter periplasmic adaptor subunit [Candidatus Binatia bacterium]
MKIIEFFQLKKLSRWAGVLLIPVLLVIAVSCKRGDAEGKPANVDYYTCTMHPSVKSQDPKAKCPICGMDLVPVMKQGAASTPNEKTNMAESEHVEMQGEQKGGMPNMPGMEGTKGVGATNEEAQPTEFTVPVARQQQIGVTYANIEKRPFIHTVRTVGIVAYDKQRHWDYVARVEGYVNKLFVFSPGELVEKNAPLLTLYSPDLLTTENEFVDLLKARDEAQAKGGQAVLAQSTDHLVESAKQRLHLWNITDDQIAELEKTRKPQEYLTLYSPFKGVVQNIGVDQGRKVMVGDHLADVADLSVVWVWVEFYQDELPMLKTGLPITITSSSYPGEKFDGKISVID